MSTSPSSPLRARVLALVVAALWLALAVPLLGDYAPGWDTTIGDLPLGERLVAYLESGDAAFLDNSRTTPVPVRPEEHLFLDGFRYPTHMVYPLGALACGVTSRVFTTELGWLGSIEGFHLAVVLFAALTLALVASFGARRSCVLVGVLAALFLAAQPRWFVHAFENPKDVPETALYFATCLAGLAAIERGTVRAWIVVGVLAGFGLAQKPNIVFAAPQLVAAWWVCVRLRVAAPVKLAGVAARIAVALTAAFVACTVVSPDAWHSPFTTTWERIFETARIARHGSRGASFPALGPLLTFLVTTPIPLLVCALAGAFIGRAPRRVRVFLVLGVLVPVGRTLAPGAVALDGVRHFLEFAPFLALLGALGADALAARVVGERLAPLRACAAAAFALPGLVAVVQLHPNQTVYFNAFVGGLGGAQARGWGGAGDYWGNSYLQAARWASAHAEKDAFVVAPIAGHVLQCIAPVALRDDLAIVEHFDPPTSGVLYVFALSRFEMRREFLARVVAEEPIVHSIRAQGGSVIDVHRVDLASADPSLLAAWRDEWVEAQPWAAVLHHVAREPELREEIRAALAVEPQPSREQIVELLAPRLPEHLRAAFASVADRLGEL